MFFKNDWRKKKLAWIAVGASLNAENSKANCAF